MGGRTNALLLLLPTRTNIIKRFLRGVFLPQSAHWHSSGWSSSDAGSSVVAVAAIDAFHSDGIVLTSPSALTNDITVWIFFTLFSTVRSALHSQHSGTVTYSVSRFTIGLLYLALKRVITSTYLQAERGKN